MSAAFVDTNVLLYAAGNAPAERPKSAMARHLLKDEEIALSAQVIQEFYWVATRPNKLALTHDEAMAFIDVWKMFPFQATTLGIVEDALFLCDQLRISYWDAAIVAAARHLNCKTLYTEDLTDRQNYGGVIVVNPFLVK
jgi:predicted nucleic acid-binding protein